MNPPAPLRLVSENAIAVEGLTKRYPAAGRGKPPRVAVDDLSLSVAAGEVFGFLGPNGAGKTTTIKMLLDFVRPTSGAARIFDRPVEEEAARGRVGYVPEQPYFPKFLTCAELVRTHAALHGLASGAAKRRADDCLGTVGMAESAATPLARLSKGMTQRVGLACALVGDPALLILDEPSSGLDPVGRRELRALLSGFRREGRTIFVSSHLLTEMEPVCDRVGVLAAGRLVACGRPSEIVEARDQVAVAFQGAGGEQSAEIARQVAAWGGGLADAGTGPGGAERRAVIPAERVYAMVELLRGQRAVLRSVAPQRETLEEAFLRLVGKAA